MDDKKEKLIELLRVHPCSGIDCEKCEKFGANCWLAALAEKLIANGVTVADGKDTDVPAGTAEGRIIMTNEDLDRILASLDARYQRTKEQRLIKARAEIEAIDREYTAYYDGAYDAIKAVKAIMPESQKGE